MFPHPAAIDNECWTINPQSTHLKMFQLFGLSIPPQVKFVHLCGSKVSESVAKQQQFCLLAPSRLSSIQKALVVRWSV